MESWKYALDRWLTTEPKPPASRCKCYRCKEELFPDDAYYTLDEEIYCGYCAEKWLGEQRKAVTRELAYGD